MTTIMIIGAGVFFIILISAIVSCLISRDVKKNALPGLSMFFVGKLDDSTTKDDINEAIKYLKRTDSFANKIHL